MTLWMIGNIAFFTWKFVQYKDSKYFTLFKYGISISKGAAAVLSFNSALMLVTMLRNFLSAIRSSFIGDLIPVDKNIVFHRYMGYTIGIFATIHIMGHMWNYNAIEHHATPVQLGWFGFDKAPNMYLLLWGTLSGSTGVFITLTMVFMYTSAFRFIRGPMFNVFWYTHHLFIVYFGLLLAHGAAALFGKPQFWYYFIGPGFLYN